jgi:hypothetical protein
MRRVPAVVGESALDIRKDVSRLLSLLPGIIYLEAAFQYQNWPFER